MVLFEYQQVLESVKSHQFDNVGRIWMKFWNCSRTDDVQMDEEMYLFSLNYSVYSLLIMY